MNHVKDNQGPDLEDIQERIFEAATSLLGAREGERLPGRGNQRYGPEEAARSACELASIVFDEATIRRLLSEAAAAHNVNNILTGEPLYNPTQPEIDPT